MVCEQDSKLIGECFAYKDFYIDVQWFLNTDGPDGFQNIGVFIR